jgi:hypothetical protein
MGHLKFSDLRLPSDCGLVAFDIANEVSRCEPVTDLDLELGDVSGGHGGRQCRHGKLCVSRIAC